MTTMSDLPVDLVGMILSRVPLTSLSAVRCTCKPWNALSKQQIFGKTEVEATQQFVGFMMRNSKLCSLRFDLQGIRNDGSGSHQKISRSNLVKTISIKQISELNQVEVYDEVFHCDGLLLCVTMDCWRLMVWNPYLGQIRWIRLRKQFRGYRDNFTLGYDNNNRNHKIMMFFYHGTKRQCSEIYDFNSDAWRVVESTPIWNLQRGAVSLKGNTYFFAQDKIETEEEKFENYLLCFDFTAEIFGPYLPLPFHFNETGDVILSCVRQEQLALLYYNSETIASLEIWITNQVDPNAVSWCKFLKVTHTGFPNAASLGSFFIDEVKKVAVVSDLNDYNLRTKQRRRCYHKAYIIGGDGYFKSLKLRCYEPPDFLAYAPSLVHIQTNQPTRQE